MKIQLILWIAILGFVLPSCYSGNGNVGANNFFGGGVSGEGEMIRKKLDVRDFESIDLQGSMDIVLTQGDGFLVEAEGQENIIDLLNTAVDGNTWKVRLTKNVRNYKGLTVYITMPSLKNLHVSGSGNVRGANTFEGLGVVDIGVSGSGNIQLGLQGESVETRVSGSGNIQLELNAKSLEARISGSGDIKLAGQSDNFDAGIMGSGDINAANLKTRSAGVSIAGSGDCSVDVSGSLKVKIAGSGDVYYTGEPQVEQKVSGSGEVKRRG